MDWTQAIIIGLALRFNKSVIIYLRMDWTPAIIVGLASEILYLARDHLS